MVDKLPRESSVADHKVDEELQIKAHPLFNSLPGKDDAEGLSQRSMPLHTVQQIPGCLFSETIDIE